VGGDTGGSNSTAVYYTSTARLQAAASLDLVGLTSQNLANGDNAALSGSLTAGNTRIVGGLDVVGQTNLSQSVSINSNLTVRPSSDNPLGFRLADKLDNTIVNVNTTTLDNLLLDGNFEGTAASNVYGANLWSRYNGTETLATSATSKFGSQ